MNNLVAQDTITQLQEAIKAAPEHITEMDQFTDHFFAPGVYVRTLFIPAGMIAIGKEHKRDTINILLKGDLSVVMDSGEREVIRAPFIFVAKPGRKAVYAATDVWFANVHPNESNTQDLEQLELEHIKPCHNTLEKL